MFREPVPAIIGRQENTLDRIKWRITDKGWMDDNNNMSPVRLMIHWTVDTENMWNDILACSLEPY